MYTDDGRIGCNQDSKISLGITVSRSGDKKYGKKEMQYDKEWVLLLRKQYPDVSLKNDTIYVKI